MITSLLNFTQEELLSGSQADKDQRLLIMAQLLKETQRDRDQVVKQNRQLRTDNGNLEDDARYWKEQAAQKREQDTFQLTERIRELETTLKDERITQAQKDIRHQKYDEARRRILRLPNTKMGSSDKLVALDYLEQANARFWDLEDYTTPFTVVMEHMAERVGLSPSQLTRINQTQKTARSWKYDVKRTFVKQVGRKKIYDCEVTVALDKIITDPNSIEKPVGKKGAHQGGARVRTCINCGSDDLDRVAVEYCRSCKKADIQLLPGLRSDMSVDDVVTAIKTDQYTVQDHLYFYTHDNEQEHDAFSQDDLAAIDTEIEELREEPTTTENFVTQTPLTFVTDQKHDAPVPDQQNAEQSLNQDNLQDKDILRLSLHLAQCSCCKEVERGPKPTAPCWQCGNHFYRWHHLSPRSDLNQRWVCEVCS